MHPLALGPPSLLSILHIQIFTEHRAKLLADSRFPPVVYFTHGSVCIGEGNGTPLQYSCLENPMDGGAWKAAVHGVTKSWTQLHFHFSFSCIGEENGNPLQCSCLENPRGCEAWWAAIYWVAQSWTQLKRLSSSRSSSNVCMWIAFLNCSLKVSIWLLHLFFRAAITNYPKLGDLKQ